MRRLARFARSAAFAALALAAPAAGVRPGATGAALAQPADRVVVENVSLDIGVGVWRIPRIEAIGANLDAQALRALLAGEGDEPAHARIARLSAAELYAPTVEFEMSFANLRQTVIYRELRAQEIAAGRIGRLVVASGSVSGSVDGQTIEANAGAMSAEKIDIAGIAMLMATGKTPDGGPVTLYESTSLTDYRSKQPNATMEMRGLTGRGVRMGPTAKPLVELFRRIGALRPSEQMKPDEVIELLADMFDIYRAAEMDEARVAELRMTIAERADRFEVSLSDMAMSDFRGGVLGRYAMGPMRIEGANGVAARLGGMELAGYDLRPLIATLKLLAAEPDKIETINPTAFAPLFDRFVLKGLTVAAPSEEANGAPLDVAFDAFRIDRTAGAATRWSAALERLRVSGAPDEPRLAALREAGFDGVEGSWRMAIDYKAADNAIELADFTIDGVGAGAATLTAKLANVTEAIFTADRNIAALALLPVALKSAELRLVDRGLIDKAAALRAKKTKAKPAQARTGMIADVTKATKGFGAAPAAQAFAKALVDFVKDPKAPLTVRITAEPGVSAIDAATVKPTSDLWKKVKVEAVRR